MFGELLVESAPRRPVLPVTHRWGKIAHGRYRVLERRLSGK